jgi:glycogen synthase
MSKQLRVLYALGPENVIDSYKSWQKGEDTPSQVSITYSSQFYEVCKSLDAKGYVMAESKLPEIITDNNFIIERRPPFFANASGILYHLRQLLRGLQLFNVAIRFRPNVVLVASGTTYWFVLLLFNWVGIKVIPCLHCTLWRKYRDQTFGERIILKLSRSLFQSSCHSIHVVSRDIAEQVTKLIECQNQSIYEFNPTYRRGYFDNIAPPPELSSQVTTKGKNSHKLSAFRVLFLGRVEFDKGVFDLLEIAKLISKQGIKDIVFDICGDGTALESLHQTVKQQSLDRFFVFHGYCNKQQMHKIFGQTHIVIVPTRSDFIEGFNRAVAEGILSGRPVVTSAVCPALSYVRPAAIEVPPDNPEAYAQAILELYSNSKTYGEKRLACLKLQQQFYDVNRSWGAALKASLLSIQQES